MSELLRNFMQQATIYYLNNLLNRNDRCRLRISFEKIELNLNTLYVIVKYTISQWSPIFFLEKHLTSILCYGIMVINIRINMVYVFVGI